MRLGRFEKLTQPAFIGAQTVLILERLRQAKERAPEGAAFHRITTDKLRDDDQLSELVSPIDGSLRLQVLRIGKTDGSRMSSQTENGDGHLACLDAE